MRGELHSTRTARRLGEHTAWRTVILFIDLFFSLILIASSAMQSSDRATFYINFQISNQHNIQSASTRVQRAFSVPGPSPNTVRHGGWVR